MRLPVISGVIERRLLLNFRVNLAVLERLLPEPFRPVLVGGAGMAGVCLIRLGRVRPSGLPGWLGIGSENAAHRIAVSWERGGERREGVYIPRRDTSSWLNVLAGGRLFPGMHHHARFRIAERGDRFDVAIESNDRLVRLALAAPRDRPAAGWLRICVGRGGVGIFPAQGARLFRDGYARSLRRIGTGEPALGGRAASR